MKIKDFTPKNFNIEVTTNKEGSSPNITTVENCHALLISKGYDNSGSGKNAFVRFYICLVGTNELKVNGSSSRTTKLSANNYDSKIVNTSNNPTSAQFLSFYQDCYINNITISLNAINGVTQSNLSINGVDIFADHYFEKSGVVDTNGTFKHLEWSVTLSESYTMEHLADITGSFNGQPLLNEAVLNSPKTSFTHYLYVNGGKLGKGDNYTITEVIKSSDDNSIKWIGNENSKLKCYKYDLAQSSDDYWKTGIGSKKLDTNRDSAFSKVMNANSVSTIQQSVAFNTNTIVPYPFFTYELIPRFLKNGSEFTGNRYNITFPRNLPTSADGVNNSWANVTQIGDDTDASNEVIVLYGTPPTAETPDEQTKQDLDDSSQNNGDDNSDSGSKKPSSADVHYGSDSGSANELTKLYVVSSTQLNLLGQSLWSESYLNVLKIQDNPIENIISIKKFPFSISGTSENIKIGNVELNVTGDKINKGVHTIDFPQVKVGGKYGNFLDYEPFTSLKISLPYCGIYDLPISECMGKNLSVKYIIDLIHGDCIALVLIDNYPLYEFNGNMGVNVPLTQTDRSTAEAKHIQNVASSIMQGATGNIGSALVGVGSSMIESGLSSYNVSHTASGSGAINLASVQDIRLIYSRPLTITKDDKGTYYPYPKNYGHTHGYPCNKYVQINTLSGFFKCGDNIDLSNIKASKDIKDKIIEMLKGGVYK